MEVVDNNLNSKSISMMIVSKNVSDTDISLGTSMKLVGCPNMNRRTDAEVFGQTTDGGVRIMVAGTFLVLAYMMATGTNSSDDVRITCARNRSGSIVDSSESCLAGTSGVKTATALWSNQYNAGDLVYIRARNLTAARGSITQARLVVMKV